jgi:hypothetical protein
LLSERRKCYRALGLPKPDRTADEKMMFWLCYRDADRRCYARRKFQKSTGLKQEK